MFRLWPGHNRDIAICQGSGQPRPLRARLRRHAVSAVAVMMTAALSLLLMTPAAGGRPALADPVRWPTATAFSGTAAVGALFAERDGRLTHFCTASVVHSPRGNLLITAAHCMQGRALKPTGAIIFAPGFHDGKFPHGRWVIRAWYADSRWRASRDPDDDVAFLIAGRPGLRIEKYTGAETLATGVSLPQQVRVIGYPDSANRPVRCDAPARAANPDHHRQLVFYCDGYTDGTSGGPFLARVSAATGTGQVIGVIGGYEKGGDSPDVSYSSRLASRDAELYRALTS